MSNQGTFISVAENQDGKNPEIVTEDRPLPVAQTATTGNTGDFMLDVAAGTIDSVYGVNKFGGGFEAVADTKYDIYDGAVATPVYPYPSTADITDIKQLADQVAMRGESVEVQGLAADWSLTVQTVALDATNTTTKVLLTTPLIRVFRMKVLADVVADQDINVMDSGAGTVIYGTIQAGNNQTLMALYTVPLNHTAYMTSFYSSVVDSTNKTPTGTEVGMWAADRANGYEFQLKMATSISQGGSSEHHDWRPYYKFTEKTDIKMTMQCNDQNGHVHAGYDLILIPNA